MNRFFKLSLIGFFAGLVLMLVLKIAMVLTGNTAYILLFNFDYIPFLNELKPVWLFGYLFHFLTCIFSVIALYFILRTWGAEKKLIFYLVVYTIGGGALFFLTALSPQRPAANDFLAWMYWTLAHALFGIVVAFSIKKYLKAKK